MFTSQEDESSINIQIGQHFKVGQPLPSQKVKLSDLNFDRIGLSGAFNQKNPVRKSQERKSHNSSSSNDEDFKIRSRGLIQQEHKKSYSPDQINASFEPSGDHSKAIDDSELKHSDLKCSSGQKNKPGLKVLDLHKLKGKDMLTQITETERINEQLSFLDRKHDPDEVR